MADNKREISGFFLSAEKFVSHASALARPDCSTTHLRLFHNEPQHTAAVVDALRRNASVTSLDIFELDPSAASALADVLATPAPCITALAVHHPHDHEAVQNLCRGISASHTLTSLHLAQLDSQGVAALATALLSWSNASPTEEAAAAAPSGANPRLQHFRLEKCVFTPNVAAALAAALGRQAGSLAHVEIVDCVLGDDAAEALLAAPGWLQLLGLAAAEGRIATGLHSLDMSACHVGPRGATQLGHFLAATRSLHSLNLANNKPLGCEGARALAAGLAPNRTLLRLDMSGCGVGAAGVQALAEVLRPDGGGGPPLQQLTLGFNAAGAAGLTALLGVMSGPLPCGLRNLQLDHNHVRGGELMEVLQSAVVVAPLAAEPPPLLPRVTGPLEQLSLAGNALYDIGVTGLAACLAEASCLELLDLRENGISDAGVAALLPLIAPRGGGGGGGGGALPPAQAAITDTAAAAAGLQGLLLDGNRLHNAGGKSLLEAVAAAPGLWRFSAEANKLTDPALRLSLTQLSQLRAARHSQLVVLGRCLSSSSSSAATSEDGADRRSSGGGGGGIGPRRSHDATSPMGVDVLAVAVARPAEAVAQPPPGDSARVQTQPQQLQSHKHRLEDGDAAVYSNGGDGDEGGCIGGGGGDEEHGANGQGQGRQSLQRNVAARGAEGPYMAHGSNGGGGSDGGGCGGGGGDGGANPMPFPLPLPAAGTTAAAWPVALTGRTGCGASGSAGPGSWYGLCAVPGSRDCSSGGCSGSGSSSLDSSSCGDMAVFGDSGSSVRFTATAAAVTASSFAQCTSASPAMYFVTVTTGVGGAASVGVSKRVGALGEPSSYYPKLAPTVAAKAPQQLLPAFRAPRYKPLTPEQQRLFEDF